MNQSIGNIGLVELLTADRDRVANLVMQPVSRGRDIVSNGETPEHVHVVVSGWAARYQVLPDGSRQIVAFVLPGDVCNGETAILKHTDHGIVTLTPVIVATVQRDTLITLIQDRPELARAFWRAKLVDEAVLRTWVANIGRRDAHGRVAHL